MIFSEELFDKAKSLIDLAVEQKVKIASAESCSAGLISALITEISGSSKVFERGFVTYSNLAKQQMLGVDEVALKEYGAVSAQIAEEMAIGAIKNSAADISIAVTGIAGPDGGTIEKPVGLVYIASYNKLSKSLISKEFHFSGNRRQVRMLTVEMAIDMLINQL